MSLLTRRMDTTEDFTAHSPTKANYTRGMSSTSGDGEPAGGYTFTTRRKPRRKTITPSDIAQDPTTTQSFSESAVSPPPIFSKPATSKSKLPPIQTNLVSVSDLLEGGGTVGDIEDADEGIKETKSPRRSTRTANSSPIKKHPSPTKASAKANSGSSTPGGTKKASIVYEKDGYGISGTGGRAYARGIPRTLTLPAHLTDSLMKMKIGTREDSTSVESFLHDPSKSPLNLSSTQVSGSGPQVQTLGDEGMDVDMDEVPRSQDTVSPARLTLSTNLRATPEQDLPPPPSPRKKKRRARSLPPSSTPSGPARSTSTKAASGNRDDDGCDADDEGGGGNAGEDPDVISPLTTTVGGQSMMGIGRGSSPGVLRRSARRLKPKNLLDRISGLGTGRMEADEEEMVIGEDERMFPRKRARTREGSWANGSGELEGEQRVSKRIRKR